ncbi:MAG: hypothetical protein JWO38_922, partial [Gemmataceae bacterium]|nr:hypothetical protein [Gemmataceae bacterium]
MSPYHPRSGPVNLERLRLAPATLATVPTPGPCP